MTSLPIHLQSGFIPSCKVGDKVAIGDVLAKKTKVREELVHVADAMGVNAHDVGRLIKKNPGDSIKKGDILAEKKSLFGNKRVVATMDGTLSRIERDSGIVAIHLPTDTEESQETETLISPLVGTISLCDNEQIVIDTLSVFVQGLLGIGGNTQGVVVLVGKTGEVVKPEDLDSNIIEKIIIGSAFSRDSLLKAIGMDVTGIIAIDIREEDLAYISDKNIKTPIIQVKEDDYKKLIKCTGKTLYIEGTAKTIILLAEYKN